MSVANVAAIEAASTMFIARYEESLAGADPVWPHYCEEVPSIGQLNTYHWAPLGVSVEEWIGSRPEGAIEVYDYTIRNRKWAVTERVPVDVFEDDDASLKLFANRFGLMGRTAAKHPDKLLAEVMDAGFTATGPDGVAFFSASHPTADGANNRSNLATGALSAANFELALDKLYKMKAYNGDCLDVVSMGQLVLTVPPTLRSAAETILEKEYLSTGETNTNYHRAKLRVMPELEAESTTAWYLSIEGAPVKPFLFQKRMAPELYVISDPNQSDSVFENDEIKYGTKARYNVGYGYPELCVGSTGL